MYCARNLFLNVLFTYVPTDCIGKSCDEAFLNTAEGKEELATAFENGLGIGVSCYVSSYDPEDQSSSAGFASLAPVYLMVTLGAILFF